MKKVYKRRVPQIKYREIKTDTIPTHMYVDKLSEDLVADLDDMTASYDEIQDEYRKIEDFVTKHIEPKESVSVASAAEVMSKNRYRDMIPYDSNIVYLSQETGDPASTYINASWVKRLCLALNELTNLSNIWKTFTADWIRRIWNVSGHHRSSSSETQHVFRILATGPGSKRDSDR